MSAQNGTMPSSHGASFVQPKYTTTEMASHLPMNWRAWFASIFGMLYSYSAAIMRAGLVSGSREGSV